MKAYFVLTLILAALFSFSGKTFAQNKTELIGTVIAKQALYGHIYDDEEIIPRLLIVRVDQKIKGEIASKYVLLNYYWRLKDEQTPYDGSFATQWHFSVTKEKNCSSALADIQFVIFGQNDTGIMPRFFRTQGIDFEPLPFNEKLPCYKLKRDDFYRLGFKADENKFSSKDTEFYVLEKERWINTKNSPLEISLLPRGGFALKNISEKNISEFQFGCLIGKSSGDFNVLESFPTEKTDLKPQIQIFSINSIGTNQYMEQLKICHDKNAMFGVIKIKFNDGSVWQISQP